MNLTPKQEAAAQWLAAADPLKYYDKTQEEIASRAGCSVHVLVRLRDQCGFKTMKAFKDFCASGRLAQVLMGMGEIVAPTREVDKALRRHAAVASPPIRTRHDFRGRNCSCGATTNLMMRAEGVTCKRCAKADGQKWAAGNDEVTLATLRGRRVLR